MNKFCPNCNKVIEQSDCIFIKNKENHNIGYCKICKSNTGIWFLD